MDGNEYNNETRPNESGCKKISLSGAITAVLAVLLAVAIALFALTKAGYIRLGSEEASTDGDTATARLEEVYRLLKSQYMGELDDEAMITEALKAYVEAVGDPYTQYMEKVEADTFIDGQYGNQSGIGVRVFRSDDPVGIYVKYVFPNSPANEAGILQDDVIIAVGNTVITDDNYSDAVNMIAGEAGTSVTLTIKRGEETKLITAVRGSFTVSPIEYKLLADTERRIAYIRIDGVASDSAEALREAIEELKAQNAEAYIFDVRDDGGGYLSEVVSMLDMLLPEGPIVRYTHTGEEKEHVDVSDADVIVEAPMAVLINGYTASAAELFAAALSDYKIATLVGETTYGKGVIQTIYKLENGDSVKITTGKYSPPYSDNFHGVGVKPDVEVSLPEGTSYNGYADKDDAQLMAAVALLEEALSQKQ